MAKTSKTRRCPRCKQDVSIKLFRKRTGEYARKHGRLGKPYGFCRPCEAARRGDSRRSFLVTVLAHCRKRARARGQPFDLTLDDLMDLVEEQKSVCALSGVPLTYTAGEGVVFSNVSVDRIEHGKLYTKSNIRLVCYSVNVMRGRMSDEELVSWCRAIVDKDDQDKSI